MNFRLLLVQLYNVIGTIFIICFSNPIFITVVVPIFIMYYFLQKFYVTTARQVRTRFFILNQLRVFSMMPKCLIQMKTCTKCMQM